MKSENNDIQHTENTKDPYGYGGYDRYKYRFYGLEGPTLNRSDISEDDIVSEEELKRFLKL